MQERDILSFLEMNDFQISKPYMVCKYWYTLMNSEEFAVMYLGNQWSLTSNQKQVLKKADRFYQKLRSNYRHYLTQIQSYLNEHDDCYCMSESSKRIDSFFILDRFGNELFYRNFDMAPLGAWERYKFIKENTVSSFVESVIQAQDMYHIRPIFHTKGKSFAFISKQDLYFVVVSNSIRNNAMEMICLLYKIHDLLCEILGRPKIGIDNIRINHTLIWLLVDEVLCLGMTQNSTANELKEILKASWPEKALLPEIIPTYSNAPSVHFNATPIEYRRNEIFWDWFEKSRMTVTSNGQISAHQVSGKIDVTCYISGLYPELILMLNRRFQDYWALDGSVKLFKDVKLNEEKTISFIPPDGHFELLRYMFERVTTAKAPHFSLRLSLQNISTQGLTTTAAEVQISLQQNFDVPIYY
ncbi:hypothetical protein C9374_003160 [Naegleria lovaniensis]|uniref:MHD domain-containing protein n=1 Tax=Naegleria lovaniensis TaxID=51637 RepID=A0AA88GPM6_NAELO|nr:uncharacterized protein C9374_003160 [Naegleria lovaniensis]KAG2386011.1 hypothetical protein C9374_003160 [Naegleria lovaniensis]